jgi:hypothetical protein
MIYADLYMSAFARAFASAVEGARCKHGSDDGSGSVTRDDREDAA